jgi:hypothetical protein
MTGDWYTLSLSKSRQVLCHNSPGHIGSGATFVVFLTDAGPILECVICHERMLIQLENPR